MRLRSTNPKKIWKYINSKRKTREAKIQMDLKSEKTDQDEEKTKILSGNCSSVYTDEPKRALLNIPKKQITQIWKKIEIKEEDIVKLLKELKEDKSPGLDKMHPIKSVERTEPRTVKTSKLNTQEILGGSKSAR